MIGAAADFFGKTRLMIGYLALLGLASILGALSTSLSLLFATRILAGIGSGGVFPIALSLTSEQVLRKRFFRREGHLCPRLRLQTVHD